MDVIGERKDPRVVGHHHRCLSFLGHQSPQQLHCFLTVLGVQRGRGFVGQNQPGIVGQGPGNRHPLALAGTEVAGMGVDLFAQSHRLQQMRGPGYWPPASATPCRVIGTQTFSRAVSRE